MKIAKIYRGRYEGNIVSYYDEIWYVCEECGGAGEVECEECGGWGCEVCNDKGIVTCDNCDGRGEVSNL